MKKYSIKGNGQLFEKTFWDLYYKNKKKFLDNLIFDILVNGINSIQGGFYSKVVKRLMYFHCTISQRYPALSGVISENAHGPAFLNIQKSRGKMNALLGPHIINRYIQESY